MIDESLADAETTPTPEDIAAESAFQLVAQRRRDNGTWLPQPAPAPQPVPMTAEETKALRAKLKRLYNDEAFLRYLCLDGNTGDWTKNDVHSTHRWIANRKRIEEEHLLRAFVKEYDEEPSTRARTP